MRQQISSIVGIFDAKTRLSELLDKVQAGQTFTITKRGQAIAELKPVQSNLARKQAALEALRQIRESMTTTVSREEIRSYINAGRK